MDRNPSFVHLQPHLVQTRRQPQLCYPWMNCPISQTPVFLIMSDNTAPSALLLTQVWGAWGTPQISPDAMSSASPGALHSMLGAMDKRVSEEVRRGSGWDIGHNQRGSLNVLSL